MLNPFDACIIERGPFMEHNSRRQRDPRWPDITELARQILTAEGANAHDRDVAIAAAERAYERLRERLIIHFGPLGFHALWARTLQLTEQAYPASDRDTSAQDSSLDS